MIQAHPSDGRKQGIHVVKCLVWRRDCGILAHLDFIRVAIVYSADGRLVLCCKWPKSGCGVVGVLSNRQCTTLTSDIPIDYLPQNLIYRGTPPIAAYE